MFVEQPLASPWSAKYQYEVEVVPEGATGPNVGIFLTPRLESSYRHYPISKSDGYIFRIAPALLEV